VLRKKSLADEDGRQSASLLLDKGPGASTVFRGMELFERIEEALLAVKEEHRQPGADH